MAAAASYTIGGPAGVIDQRDLVERKRAARVATTSADASARSAGPGPGSALC